MSDGMTMPNEFPMEDPGNGAGFEDPFEVELDDEAANEAYAEFERLMDDFPETETGEEEVESSEIPTEP